ncbi:hypothetical protein EDD90_9052 [Streptomyces sp. Ag109_O5-1]|nr:hypothetical protein EDD90_9052 [Streptomyces sp. Ag109_O5-1]
MRTVKARPPLVLSERRVSCPRCFTEYASFFPTRRVRWRRRGRSRASWPTGSPWPRPEWSRSPRRSGTRTPSPLRHRPRLREPGRARRRPLPGRTSAPHRRDVRQRRAELLVRRLRDTPRRPDRPLAAGRGAGPHSLDSASPFGGPYSEPDPDCTDEEPDEMVSLLGPLSLDVSWDCRWRGLSEFKDCGVQLCLSGVWRREIFEPSPASSASGSPSATASPGRPKARTGAASADFRWANPSRVGDPDARIRQRSSSGSAVTEEPLVRYQVRQLALSAKLQRKRRQSGRLDHWSGSTGQEGPSRGRNWELACKPDSVEGG